ncbi:MAG: helix-turn-helix transcriptional regulator [Roseivirga sp.]|nr:helix-turn-helix transcriptional regulator [Roseivirga sp.]
MILDVYTHFRDTPGYNKLVGEDYCLIEYKCPIEAEKFKLWTESHFISFVIKGKKDWTSLDKTYQIKAGDALFIRKGVYNTKQYFEEDYCTILFFMTDDFIRNFMREYKGADIKSVNPPDRQIFEVKVDQSMESLFQSVFSYMTKGGDIPRELVMIKFKELLFNLMMSAGNEQIIQFFHSVQSLEKAGLDEIMRKNFHCELSMEEFARLSGRSLSTFKRDFKKLYNDTPQRWLINKRLQYARTLLLTTDLNTNEVCFESGFANVSHFNRAFKEKYNLPPNQFRQAQLQDT